MQLMWIMVQHATGATLEINQNLANAGDMNWSTGATGNNKGATGPIINGQSVNAILVWGPDAKMEK